MLENANVTSQLSRVKSCAEIEEHTDTETAQENLVKKPIKIPLWNYLFIKADNKEVLLLSELDKLICSLCSKCVIAK